MKCPGCGASFSDLRDLCPGCFGDLRQHKQLLGIAVTYPGLGYSELLQRLEKRAYLNKLSLQRTPLVQMKPTSPQIDEISTLFENTYQEVKLAGEKGFEITIEQFQTHVNPEEIQLFYDLLLESLEDPEGVQEYVEDVITSDKKSLEASALTEELVKFQKVTEVPVFNLKGTGLRSRADSKIAESGFPDFSKGEEITGIKRLFALTVDTAIIISVSVIAAVALSAGSPDASTAMSIHELIVLHSAPVTLASALIWPIGTVYYLMSKLVVHESFGGYLVRG